MLPYLVGHDANIFRLSYHFPVMNVFKICYAKLILTSSFKQTHRYKLSLHCRHLHGYTLVEGHSLVLFVQAFTAIRHHDTSTISNRIYFFRFPIVGEIFNHMAFYIIQPFCGKRLIVEYSFNISIMTSPHQIPLFTS